MELDRLTTEAIGIASQLEESGGEVTDEIAMAIRQPGMANQLRAMLGTDPKQGASYQIQQETAAMKGVYSLIADLTPEGQCRVVSYLWNVVAGQLPKPR